MLLTRIARGTFSGSLARMIVGRYNNLFVANFASKDKKFDAMRKRLPPTPTEPEMPLDIDEYLRNIDTTLTPEQREKVDKLKRKIRGGPNQPRSFYRDAPTREEFDEMEFDTFPPKFTDNAQQLIDYALSHIPDRAGPRRSRYKRRLAKRREQQRSDHKRRKEQTRAAMLRRQEKSSKQMALVRLYKAEAGITMKPSRSKKLAF